MGIQLLWRLHFCRLEMSTMLRKRTKKVTWNSFWKSPPFHPFPPGNLLRPNFVKVYPQTNGHGIRPYIHQHNPYQGQSFTLDTLKKEGEFTAGHNSLSDYSVQARERRWAKRGTVIYCSGWNVKMSSVSHGRHRTIIGSSRQVWMYFFPCPHEMLSVFSHHEDGAVYTRFTQQSEFLTKWILDRIFWKKTNKISASNCKIMIFTFLHLGWRNGAEIFI